MSFIGKKKFGKKNNFFVGKFLRNNLYLFNWIFLGNIPFLERTERPAIKISFQQRKSIHTIKEPAKSLSISEKNE